MSIKKAIGGAFVLFGALAAFLGMFGIISIVGILPGILGFLCGTFVLCIGLLIGWPTETQAWLIKRKAQQEARKRQRAQAIEEKTQEILDAQEPKTEG